VRAELLQLFERAPTVRTPAAPSVVPAQAGTQGSP